MGFTDYFQLGLEHISDLKGYDHMVFIIAMCCIYKPSEWKKILILVTAFTIGHSLTLALAALDIIRINSEFIEFLIPLTICLTAIWNVLPKKEKPSSWFSWNYLIVLFFGLIHGLGFSNNFKMLIGREGNIVEPLFGFNVGVEIGQFMIVLVFMSIAYYFLERRKIKFKDWILFVSGMAFGISCILILESDWINEFIKQF